MTQTAKQINSSFDSNEFKCLVHYIDVRKIQLYTSGQRRLRLRRRRQSLVVAESVCAMSQFVYQFSSATTQIHIHTRSTQ